MTKTALTLTVTRAGLERFTAAQLGEDIDLAIAEVGLSDTGFVAAPTLDKLPGMFRRLKTISGDQVGDNIIHMIIRDDDDIGYYARGFGLFLADGTLFATYAQPDRLFEKSPRASFLAAIDIAFPTGDVSDLTFGDTSFLNPPATTERKGVAEIATQAETDAGTDMTRIVTPKTLAVRLAALKKAIDDALAAFRADLETRFTGFRDTVTAQLAAFAGRSITGAGLATGGGTLVADRVITVPRAGGSDIVAGDDSKAVTGRALTSMGGGSGGTGWCYELGGDRLRIRVWGQFVAAGNGTTAVIFPRAFPTACEGVLVSGGRYGTDNQDNYAQPLLETLSPSGFTVANSDNANACFFTAWGY